MDATLDGVRWTTSVWRDSKNDRSLIAVPSRLRRGKGHGDTVTLEFTFQTDDD